MIIEQFFFFYINKIIIIIIKLNFKILLLEICINKDMNNKIIKN